MPLLFFIKKLSAYRTQLIIGILLSLCLTISASALLTLSGWFISAAAFAGLSVITAAGFNYFIPAAVIRFLALVRILSRYFDRVINHDYTFKILTQLRVWFYQKLIPLAPAHLLSHRSGDLLNCAVNDINTLDHLYLNIISPLIITLFLLISVTFFTMHFSLSLSLIMLSTMLFSLLFILLITYKNTQQIGKHIQEETALLRTHIIDFLQGFIDVLLFVKKEKRLQSITDAHNQLMQAQKKLSTLKGFTQGAVQLFSGITVFLILIIGIPMVRHHDINGAELAMIIFLIIATFEQLSLLPTAFLSIGKTQNAANRILAVTTTIPAVVFPEKSVDKNSHYDIQFKNVSFAYSNNSTPVLHNMNLYIKTGTYFGITGPSGAGKTTLANLIARIWDPTKGEIIIGDHPLKTFSACELRNNIALVTQHVHIFNASVRDNLTVMQNTYSDENCFYVLEKMDLADTIRKLPEGLNTIMGEFGKKFSGGQIRRIAIARALLHNPPIIILDEPSAGLEHALAQRIWQNCETDFKDKTIIVITHDEKLLQNMDQRIKIDTSVDH